MKEYIITLASGEKETVKFPLTWFDTPTELYERIWEEWDQSASPESLVKLFSIITGGKYTDYITSTDNRIERIILEAVKFVVQNPVDLQSMPKPRWFKIEGRTIELPKYDIQYKRFSLGQMLTIRKLMYNKDVRSGISLACALYVQPLLDGKFDDNRVDYYQAIIKKMPITDTFPIGFFILRRANNVGNGLLNYLHLIWQITQNSMLAARSLLKPVSQKFLTHITQSELFKTTVIFFRPSNLKKQWLQ
jgi:hypothetical protein